MRIGILGLAQSGKKTLFRLITGSAPAASHGKQGLPLGVGRIPDERVAKLADVYGPKKTRLAESEWTLFPNLPAEERSRRDWFEEARELDGLCCIVRQFPDPGVYHEDGSVDPARDLERLDLELALADLSVIETRIERVERDTARKTAADRGKQLEVLGRLKAEIEGERPLRGIELTRPEEERLSGLKFLSRKSCLVVVNVDEAVAADEAAVARIASSMPARGRQVVCVSAKVEAELAEIDDPAERAELLAGLGLGEPAAARIARALVAEFGLVTFLTANRNEVRAWLIRRGAAAPEAAGVVHTDFERGFIRAEVMRCDELLAAGSEAKLREQGKVALKGKDYVVQEGDILHILSNA